MDRQWWKLAAWVAMTMAWAAGCVPATGRYERCELGDVCAGLSTCAVANTPAAGMAALPFCTQSCITGNDCPAGSNGVAAACVTNGGTSQCYRQCDAGGGCPLGEVCSTLAGMPTSLCVPAGSTGTPACGGSGQVCCAGNACSAGLTCGTPVGGSGMVCGVAAACGGAGQACCAGNACSAGLTCGTPVGGSGLVCGTATTSCGGAGQPCCTGNVCTAGYTCGTPAGGSGLVCGTAVPGPYAGCTPPGATCGGGTQCMNSIATGTGSFCTLGCTGLGSACAQAPNGYSTNCYVFNNVGQCFQDCNLGMPCQPGTTCRAVTPDGIAGTVSICTP
jgi:hypothetical protein